MPNPRKIEPQFNPKLRHESTPLKSGSAVVRVILVVTGTTLNVVNRGGGGGASGFQTLTLSLTRSLTLSLHLSLSWCRGGRPVPDLPVLRRHRSAGLPQPLSSLSCCGFGVGVPRAPLPFVPLFEFFAGNVRGFGPLLPPFFVVPWSLAHSTNIACLISNLVPRNLF